MIGTTLHAAARAIVWLLAISIVLLGLPRPLAADAPAFASASIDRVIECGSIPSEPTAKSPELPGDPNPSCNAASVYTDDSDPGLSANPLRAFAHSAASTRAQIRLSSSRVPFGRSIEPPQRPPSA